MDFNITGECRQNQNQAAHAVGEKEISGDTYPQHGSIQLETLASSTELETQPNGDNSVPKKKIKVTGSRNLVSACFLLFICLGLDLV